MTSKARIPCILVQYAYAAGLALVLFLCPVWPRMGTPPVAGQDAPWLPLDARPAAGRLLVAGEAVSDPYFRRSVVLLLDHGEQGSLGVIINRPTTLSLSSLSEKFLRGGDTDVLYYGGPVQPMSFSMLVDAEQAFEEGRAVSGNIFHVFGAHRIMSILERLDPQDTVRIYSGFAGWAPGQLDHEIGLGGWHVLPGKPAHVFTDKPESLWDELNLASSGQWL